MECRKSCREGKKKKKVGPFLFNFLLEENITNVPFLLCARLPAVPDEGEEDDECGTKKTD